MVPYILMSELSVLFGKGEKPEFLLQYFIRCVLESQVLPLPDFCHNMVSDESRRAPFRMSHKVSASIDQPLLF